QPLAHSTEEDPRVALLARAALFEPAVAEVPGTEEVFEGAVSRRAAAGDVLAGEGEQLGAEIGEAFGAADRGIDLGAGRPEHLRHDGGDADDHEVAERADDDGGGDSPPEPRLRASPGLTGGLGLSGCFHSSSRR